MENKIEVIVASDGSSDNTVDIVKALSKEFTSLLLVESKKQIGRARIHNKAKNIAKYDILIFTDADTTFDEHSIKNITAAFLDENIGFASGKIFYTNQLDGITNSSGLYWEFELFLRGMESSLGILASGSGPFCAVRKHLYKDIPSTGDVDFTTPIDVVMQGYKCVYVSDAIAFDLLPDTPKREFKSRVRMTSKNFHGILSRIGLEGVFKHPIYALSLFFHKILRWLTPFFLVSLLISNLALISNGELFLTLLIIQLTLYFSAIAGFFYPSLPVIGKVYAFLLANAAFAIGVVNALTGKIPSLYNPINKT